MKATVSLRLFFAFLSLMLWSGIYFTGFSVVSWLLYLPASVSLFAAVTGICPSLIMIKKITAAVKKKPSPNT